MINRRLIRIKVFKTLYSTIHSQSDSLSSAEKELLHSFDKSLDLYYFLLDLPSALKAVAEERIEIGLNKYQPTEEEKNPNRRFIENSVITILEEDETIKSWTFNKGLNWRDHLPFVKKLYREISEREYFKEYMESEKFTFRDEKKLLLTIFEQELEESEELDSIIEDTSLFWLDDLAYVLGVIINRLKRVTRSNPIMSHPNPFSESEDREYALRLLASGLLNYNAHTDLISQHLHNWETDRLASTDIALIVLGISEAITFEQIPIKVTINEYVELSKYYSTPNSRGFVNGILDKILHKLIEEGKIVKSGRGLVESLD